MLATFPFVTETSADQVRINRGVQNTYSRITIYSKNDQVTFTENVAEINLSPGQIESSIDSFVEQVGSENSFDALDGWNETITSPIDGKGFSKFSIFKRNPNSPNEFVIVCFTFYTPDSAAVTKAIAKH